MAKFNRTDIEYQVEANSTYFVGLQLGMFRDMSERFETIPKTFKGEEVYVDKYADAFGLGLVDNFERDIHGFYQNRGFVVFKRISVDPNTFKEVTLFIVVSGKHVKRVQVIPEGFSVPEGKFSDMKFRMSEKQKIAAEVCYWKTVSVPMGKTFWMTAKQLGFKRNTMESLAASSRMLVSKKISADGTIYYKATKRAAKYFNQKWFRFL